MLLQRSKDSISAFNQQRNIYCVQTLPYEKNLRAKKTFEIDREQLERQYFAKLQDHKGVIIPFLGVFFRYLVWTFLLPFYAIRSLCQKIYQKYLALKAYIIKLLTPPVNFLKKVFLLAKNRIVLVTNKISALGQKAIFFCSSHLKKASKPVVEFLHSISIKFHSKISQFSTITRQQGQVVNKGVFQLLTIPFLKLRELQIQISTQLSQAYQVSRFHISTTVSNVAGLISALLYSAAIKVKIQRVRAYVWLCVLTRYAGRVLEDWILEIKQLFAVQSK